jgi:hypothetical protein
MVSGFNVVDFMDLPPVERCLVRLILRETTMTYPELQQTVTTLPPDQQMDQTSFDSALNHLTFSQWLIRQTQEQQVTYRVNTLQKNATQNPGLLEGLDLEKMDEPRSPQLNLETADQTLAPKRSRRGLPTHIWDCLTESSADEPVSQAPKRHANLFDKFVDGDGDSKI